MKKKSGFTILELVLVLAIAGIIFLMAFIALPSLWASQRDAERKANVMSFVAAVKNYQTNNSRGALPILSGDQELFTGQEARDDKSNTNSWKNFFRDYVDRDMEDPSGTDYNIHVVKCGKSGGGDSMAEIENVGEQCSYPEKFNKANNKDDVNLNGGVDYTLYVAIGATCKDDYAAKSSNSRSVAVVYVLERAGRYCYNT